MQLAFTAIALAWLDPPSTWVAVSASALALAIPLATAPILAERELRQRNHSAALARHYLDGLLGLVAARTHGAERALRQRHEMLLVEWGRSCVHLLRGGAVIEGVQTLVGSLLAVWLVLEFVGRGNRPGSTLLLVYWALSLPLLGRELAAIFRELPGYRNVLARVLEPLGAPEEAPTALATREHRRQGGVTIEFDRVDVQVGKKPVLQEIDLTIKAGDHVAIVGRSGAGQSNLVGLLLGWSAPTGGVTVDGLDLDAAHIAELRRSTAWIDPSVHLWNRSLFDNLRYGDPSGMIPDIGSILETAELRNVLEHLPEGLQAPLGEGGGLTSGGEGQRVRFGRALVRQNVRLAILDEPFRGLDRRQRRDMLLKARQIWRDATLLCVTHDVSETMAFERVLVLDKGRIVEDGDPAVLARRPGSLYGTLLRAEEAVRVDLWSGARWRLWELRDGTLVEDRSKTEMSWTVQKGSPGR
jgi:ATP-binding cassette subfamily B protein